MAKKKNVSIDDLAVMIKQGFDGVDKKFEGVNGKFEGVDKKFDGVDKKFDEMDKKFTGKFDELKRDMEEIKLKFAYTAWAIDVEALKQRVNVLEKKIGIK